MSDGFLNLCFSWSVLIDLQRCVGWYYVGHLAWRCSVEQLPEVFCPPVSLLLLFGEHLSTLGSDRFVWDPFSTFQFSCDRIEPLPAASSSGLARSSTKFRQFL